MTVKITCYIRLDGRNAEILTFILKVDGREDLKISKSESGRSERLKMNGHICERSKQPFQLVGLNLKMDGQNTKRLTCASQQVKTGRSFHMNEGDRLEHF